MTLSPRSVLITGASSGIGAEFARQLAARNCRLVLVARDGDRLAAARPDLLARGAAGVDVVVADLTDSSALEQVSDLLRAQRIDLLINNAGLGLGKEFGETTEAELRYQLALNVTAVMLLTKAAVHPMESRGHGAVINVASIAGLVNGRGSTYSASKAWVVSFSEALATELAGAGIRVQALCPGFVRTEFHQRAGIDMAGTPRLLYVDLTTVVRRSLADLDRNRVVSIPGRVYPIIAAAARLAPRGLVRAVAGRIK